MPLWFLHDPFIADPDLGFHLRTGDWVLQHLAVPHIEMFSSYAMGKPWVAYSWLYELLLSALYHWQQLIGIVVYAVVLRLLIAAALWKTVARLVPHFGIAVAAVFPALYVIGAPNGPRPVLFSVLFVIVVIDSLIAAEREASAWRLWALLPIFALWANLHLQFVHGIIVMGAFALEATWQRMRNKDVGAISTGTRWITLLACTAATLINPYGIGVWKLVWTFLRQPKLYDLIIEMQAPTFRHIEDYLTLFLVIGAGFALGRTKRLRSAWILLLIFAAEQGFRSERELWFAAVIATAIIADSIGQNSGARRVTSSLSMRDRMAVAVCTIAVLAVGVRYFDVNNDFLEMQMHGSFPEVAVRYIERAHLQGKIFNDYGWGGYLMWRLPNMPVAIDGRANNVHDQDHVERVWKTWRGKPGWENDPELNAADVIVGRADYPLTYLLRNDPRFRVVHEDREAVVFVPQR